MAIGFIAPLISAGVGLFQASKAREDAQDRADAALKIQQDQQDILEKQKEEYRALTFENPYLNIENAFEDLTVNQQQAQFEAEQGAQQRASLLESFRGAAGASGIAGLAQALANQGVLQTRRAAASIGLQEAQNQKLKAAEEAKLLRLEREGDVMVQQAETSRQATLLGMQQGQTAAANAAAQRALYGQEQAGLAAQQMEMSAVSNLASMDFSGLNFSGLKNAWYNISGGANSMGGGTIKNTGYTYP
tara:strand:+ start:2382 stop:3122 length:741 start_codon:yes stop_codon:yes gene_type:complete